MNGLTDAIKEVRTRLKIGEYQRAFHDLTIQQAVDLLRAAEVGLQVIEKQEREARYAANMQNEAWLIRQADRDA